MKTKSKTKPVKRTLVIDLRGSQAVAFCAEQTNLNRRMKKFLASKDNYNLYDRVRAIASDAVVEAAGRQLPKA